MLNLSYGPWEKIELEIELFIKKKNSNFDYETYISNFLIFNV